MEESLVCNGKCQEGDDIMKYSTGKGARVRHSTAREWDELEKAKKRSGYQELKHSTGENPAVKHATGVEFDYKALLNKELEEKEGVHSKVHSKSSLVGDEYLEHYHDFQAKKRQENMKNTEHEKEVKKTEEKKIAKKTIKKMRMDY